MDIDALTRQHYPRIHRAALVLSGNPWDADDLTQETFAVFASQSDRFEGRSSLYTWLYGILLNLDRRERRRHGVRRRKLQVVADRQSQADRTMPAAETPVEVAEWKRSLWGYVDRLPEGQRQALVLRFSEGLRYDEVADVLGCPVGTVKSRIFHGLRSLRELLNSDRGEVGHIPDFPSEDVNHAV
jgi:RNA polymerase sigma-70 factor (ECF subfamily)